MGGRYAAVEQWAHRAITGIVDEHIETALFLVDSLTQLFKCRAIVDVQLHGGKPGRRQSRHVFSPAGAGPDLVTGTFKGIGQGAANAAGTSGNQRNGHGAVLVQ
jgi:hypothetical protein